MNQTVTTTTATAAAYHEVLRIDFNPDMCPCGRCVDWREDRALLEKFGNRMAEILDDHFAAMPWWRVVFITYRLRLHTFIDHWFRHSSCIQCRPAIREHWEDEARKQACT